MAGSGVHAEIRKLIEKVAKEVLRDHPMIKYATVWHKQMQDEQRTMRQTFDSQKRENLRFDSNISALLETVEALCKFVGFSLEKKDEPESTVQPLTGYQLKMFRQKRPLTQHQLGRLIGASSARIANWEKGRQEIPLEFVAKIRQIMATKASELRSIAIRNDHYLKNSLDIPKKEISPEQAFSQSMLLADDLKNIRAQLNLNMKQFAELIGIKYKTYFIVSAINSACI